jgi:hypothetical protein
MPGAAMRYIASFRGREIGAHMVDTDAPVTCRLQPLARPRKKPEPRAPHPPEAG